MCVVVVAPAVSNDGRGARKGDRDEEEEDAEDADGGGGGPGSVLMDEARGRGLCSARDESDTDDGRREMEASAA